MPNLRPMPKRAIVKHPGQKPFVEGISTEEDSITALIGFAYRTRRITQDQPIYMLYADPQSLHGLVLDNVWNPEGTIRGTVVVVRKRTDGSIESLQDDDVSWALSHLSERDANINGRTGNERRVPMPPRRDLERKSRFERNREMLRCKDDVSLAIRGSALIEHHLSEILRSSVPNPGQLAGQSFTSQQMAVLLGALGKMSAAETTLLLKLAELRNKFAHDAGYAPPSAAVRALRAMAIELEYDIEYLEYHMRQWSDDTGTLLSEESAALAAIYQAVVNHLEDRSESSFC